MEEKNSKRDFTNSEITEKIINIPICRKELIGALKALISFLFPVCTDEFPNDGENLKNKISEILHKNIVSLSDEELAKLSVKELFASIPDMRLNLLGDAYGFLENDPAAKSIEEVILAYPGFYALMIHRIAHLFYELDVPLIPRLFSEYAHSRVGIDIHPGAKIGAKPFLDHGTGIVIGETTIIGNNVKIYQGVTLGALYVDKCLSDIKRHPTIEDNVIIYAGATILGGDTVIGHDSVIGGGSWLTKSIPPYSQVYNVPTIKIFNNNADV